MDDNSPKITLEVTLEEARMIACATLLGYSVCSQNEATALKQMGNCFAIDKAFPTVRESAGRAIADLMRRASALEKELKNA